MKSIRRQLVVWLSGGLLLLWLVSGAGIYQSVQSGLIKSVDAQLAFDRELARFMIRDEEEVETKIQNRRPGSNKPGVPKTGVPKNGIAKNGVAKGGFPKGGVSKSGVQKVVANKGNSQRLAAYQDPTSGRYLQQWEERGESIQKSESLEGVDLTFPGPRPNNPEFATQVTSTGEKVRAMSFRTSPPGKGRGKNKAGAATVITIAHSMEDVENTLSILLGGLLLVGLLAAGGAVVLVGASLNRGLKPLRRLAEETNTIDASSLDARFDSSSAPVELQPIYAQLNELLGRIQYSFERERRFSADLAHEIRTPIAELKMLSEVALKWPDQSGPDTFSETLGIARQLETMVETLLTLARWESGDAALKKESVVLANLANECWQPYSTTSLSKGHEVEFAVDDESIMHTDPALLRHIIGNLFSNAVEYTPKGGEISITGDRRELKVSNRPHRLTETEVEHLFDRYWRKDEVRTDSSHVGLGLSLARACAEALNLKLTATLEGDWISFKIRDENVEPSSFHHVREGSLESVR
ncbi:MAG: ATP-binding protein [Verrucomicrobiota bacterium]